MWGAIDPVNGKTDLQSILWGAQVAAIEALRLDQHRIHTEIDYRGGYDTIRMRELIFVPENLEEAFNKFNSLFSNQFREDSMVRHISITPWT